MMPTRAWTRVARGLLARAAAGFGLAVASTAVPGAALPTLVAVYAFVDGLAILHLSGEVSSRALFLSALADLAIAGLLSLQSPVSTSGVNAVVGIWAMGTGLLALLGAASFAPAAERYLFAFGGIAGVAVGGWLGVFPQAPTPVLAGLLTLLGLVAGGTSLVIAVRCRSDAVASCAVLPRSANSAATKAVRRH